MASIESTPTFPKLFVTQVLIYFLKGNLPWQGLKAGDQKYNRIMEKTLSQVEQEISQMAESLSPDEIKEMIIASVERHKAENVIPPH